MMDSRMMRSLGVVVVLVGSLAVSSEAQVKNGPPTKSPSQPFAEILAQIAMLNDKIDDIKIPPGPPATGLCEVPPVWGKKFPGNNRFVPVLDGEAYCDKETGLVWEASPKAIKLTWESSRRGCTSRKVGGRKGWRLPSVHEFASLLDPSQNNPALPIGHPFKNVQSDQSYWSATTDGEFSQRAWMLSFNVGDVFTPNKTATVFAWCARGGMNADVY